MSERGIVRLGIALTAGFLLLSIIGGLFPMRSLHGWSAIHLALAGAAGVAIGTFMPHFGVTLAGVRPEPWPIRLAGVLALAAGMLLVALGRPLAGDPVAAWGGIVVLAGAAVTAWATFGPLRRGVARRHPLVQLTYGAALANLAFGASLAVLLLVGWRPVVESWVALKPAHAWLNIFGFVGLTVAGTLIYLYPTMLGARIRPHPGIGLMIIGLIPGAPLVAAGSILRADGVAIAGATATLAGAAGIAWSGVDTWRRRGRWTTDLAWHELTARHGMAAMAWFVVVAGAAWIGIIVEGTAVPGWSLGALTVPLIGGWTAQLLIAAMSHLLPAVGPGDPRARLRQRTVLSRLALPRVVAWNGGLLLLWPGLWLEAWPLIVPGALLFGAAALTALALLAAALLPAALLPAGAPAERGPLP